MQKPRKIPLLLVICILLTLSFLSSYAQDLEYTPTEETPGSYNSANEFTTFYAPLELNVAQTPPISSSYGASMSYNNPTAFSPPETGLRYDISTKAATPDFTSSENTISDTAMLSAIQPQLNNFNTMTADIGVSDLNYKQNLIDLHSSIDNLVPIASRQAVLSDTKLLAENGIISVATDTGNGATEHTIVPLKSLPQGLSIDVYNGAFTNELQKPVYSGPIYGYLPTNPNQPTQGGIVQDPPSIEENAPLISVGTGIYSGGSNTGASFEDSHEGLQMITAIAKSYKQKTDSPDSVNFQDGVFRGTSGMPESATNSMGDIVKHDVWDPYLVEVIKRGNFEFEFTNGKTGQSGKTYTSVTNYNELADVLLGQGNDMLSSMPEDLKNHIFSSIATNAPAISVPSKLAQPEISAGAPIDQNWENAFSTNNLPTFDTSWKNLPIPDTRHSKVNRVDTALSPL